MNKQVEAIKNEIQRRISQFESKYPVDLGGYWNDEESDAYACAEEYKRFIQFIDSIPEEPVSEDLEEEVKKWKNHYINVLDHNLKIDLMDIEIVARHFAEWQKQKDKQLVGATQKISHQHGYDEGRIDMREEMMKDAVNTIIINDWTYGKDPDHAIIPAIHQRIDGFKVGDKVKIIIIKDK